MNVFSVVELCTVNPSGEYCNQDPSCPGNHKCSCPSNILCVKLQVQLLGSESLFKRCFDGYCIKVAVSYCKWMWK